MWIGFHVLTAKTMPVEIKEKPFNRDNYIINRKWWIEHYIRLCNQEIAQKKLRMKKNGCR